MKKIIFAILSLASIGLSLAATGESVSPTDQDGRVITEGYFPKGFCIQSEIKPACGENGFTYSNRCTLEANGAKFKSYGECAVSTCKSGDEYVCGIDPVSKTNMSYKNWCYADQNKATNINLGICDQKSNLDDTKTWSRKNDALAWAKENGITAYSNWNDFNPTGILTREQAAKMIENFMNYNGLTIADTQSGCNFSDYGTIDPSLKTFVTAQCKKGIIKGANGKFYPKNTLTTAQALTLVMRALDVKSTNTTNWWLDYEIFARKSQYLSSTYDLDVNDTTPITRQQFLYLLSKTSSYITFQRTQASSANLFPVSGM